MTDALDHAETFINMIRYKTIVEKECFEYIDKYNDFYNAYTPNGWSPLRYACFSNCEQIAYKLIGVGADINSCNDGKVSPLMWATINTNAKMVTELIRLGADVNYNSIHHNSALMIALNEQIIITLIKAGAYFLDVIGIYTRYDTPKVRQCIRDIYSQHIISVIDAKDDNALAVSFRTTYAIGLVDIIGEFII
ncbi:MAG: hypothetical protein Faunusvirus2_41 [Faunusvirus sp.]|jgi:hypothetical protein|uniref:Uncharacterized protein n=1 Tax=Faunusvirus sp. TaxID=2487766 RepID=A0A3G4ZXN0_9VIRU|nr:MAG: hypothetical protein Faunusvirus2_41 [Faunusvirus sp.]